MIALVCWAMSFGTSDLAKLHRPVASFGSMTHAYLHASDWDSEIGRMTGTEFSHDSAGARNVSTLMSELGARAPKAMMQNLSVLVTHLNGEVPSFSLELCCTICQTIRAYSTLLRVCNQNYSLRNGVVQMVGKLLLTFPKSSKDVDVEEEERETAKKAGTVADDADADQEDGEEENVCAEIIVVFT